MAIVISEEGKDKGMLMNFLIWLVIVAIIAAAAYYIFFKKPTLIEIAAPANFRSTEKLLNIDLSPEDVVNDPRFQALKPYITPSIPRDMGKLNPFLGQ